MTKTSQAMRAKKVIEKEPIEKLALFPYKQKDGRLFYRLCKRTRNGYGSHGGNKYIQLCWVEFVIGDLKKLPILPNPKNI